MPCPSEPDPTRKFPSPQSRVARSVLIQLVAALVLVTVAVVLGVAFSR